MSKTAKFGKKPQGIFGVNFGIEIQTGCIPLTFQNQYGPLDVKF
jgi:hypothetical protein